MADGGVHPDVVAKLWQVYCTSAYTTSRLSADKAGVRNKLTQTAADQFIPKPQRQGAIIVLGMLAMARREVVTEKVESLLKIGLGQHGMVCPPNPRYQRDRTKSAADTGRTT